MDDQRNGAVTRRCALHRTTSLGLGAAIAWSTHAPAHAQSGKLAKDAVKYVDLSDAPGKDCDDCVQ